MLQGGSGTEDEKRPFKERVEWGREIVFGGRGGEKVENPLLKEKKNDRKPILLSEDVLDRFSLDQMPAIPVSPQIPSVLFPHSAVPPSKYRPNLHLSLLAMVDCWAHLGINPYHHLSLAATPISRLFLGVAEYLFLSPSQLQSAIHSALYDTWLRADDLEFVVATRVWSQFEEAGKLGSEMIKAIMEDEVKPLDEDIHNGTNS